MKEGDVSTPKRGYDSSGRQAQARATRARIRDAAAELFVAQGYAGTSIAAIAKAAGVAPQTVYAAFGAKAMILKEAIEVTLAGGDEPIAVFDRDEAQRAVRATTAADAADALARQCRLIFERTADLLHAGDIAALDEPEIAVMAKGGAEGRLSDMTRTVEEVAAKGFLRDGVTVEQAVDVVWALSTPSVYRSFIHDRGWTPDRYERWIRDAFGLVIG
jgi:TetR/AcrR family transcriptional regulator of autoinduction and epiphytic fitness